MPARVNSQVRARETADTAPKPTRYTMRLVGADGVRFDYRCEVTDYSVTARGGSGWEVALRETVVISRLDGKPVRNDLHKYLTTDSAHAYRDRCPAEEYLSDLDVDRLCMSQGLKVRLIAAPSAHDSRLVAGTDGYTVGVSGQWRWGHDNLVAVVFPGIGTLNVPRKHLRVTGPGYADLKARFKEEHVTAIKSATSVVALLGPRGGIRSLSYRYPLGLMTCRTPTEARRLREFFLNLGIPVVEARGMEEYLHLIGN